MEVEIKEIKCTVCDKVLEEDGELNTHHTQCANKVLKNSCFNCEYKAKSNYELKRHNRDEHGFWTQTISPKQKKQKQTHTENTEKMDIDEGNNVYNNSEKMEEPEVLLERSRMQDEKVKQREQRLQEEEKIFEEKVKHENEIKKRKEKEVKENEKKIKLLRKSRGKNKARSLRKKRNKELSITESKCSSSDIKPWLKPLPENCKSIVGDNFVLFPVKGDGACGPTSAAAWIHHDPTLGPFLAQNINKNLVKNWECFKNTITFPFVREVGNGKSVTCKNEKELFDFLIKDPASAYMWRGHEDFSAVASTYHIKITIITIRSDNDPTPIVSIIEPNPIISEKKGSVPDMMILNRENMHYDLIIPKDNRLATEGGLDRQRREASNNLNDLEKKEKERKISKVGSGQKKRNSHFVCKYLSNGRPDLYEIWNLS